MSWLIDAILAAAISAAGAGEMPSPAKPYPETRDVLDQKARSGDLMLAAAAEAGRSTQILEVEITGCLITFKTEIDRSGFKARVAQLGEGSALDFLGAKNEVRVQSAPDLVHVLTLRSKQPIGGVFNALKGIKESCGASQDIF